MASGNPLTSTELAALKPDTSTIYAQTYMYMPEITKGEFEARLVAQSTCLAHSPCKWAWLHLVGFEAEFQPVEFFGMGIKSF